MAVLAFTDAYVEINSVDMSDYVKSVAISMSVDELDTTAFGATAHSRIGGLKDGSVSLTFNQDFANATVDSRLWALLGTVVTMKVRPTSSAVGTSNPSYEFSVLVADHNPFGNSVGELAEASATWPITGAVGRVTA